jgi:hypothetical protein
MSDVFFEYGTSIAVILAALCAMFVLWAFVCLFVAVLG